jgi:hypothetical protein
VSTLFKFIFTVDLGFDKTLQFRHFAIELKVSSGIRRREDDYTYLPDGLLVGIYGRPGFPKLLNIGTTSLASFFQQLDFLLD